MNRRMKIALAVVAFVLLLVVLHTLNLPGMLQALNPHAIR